MDRKKYIAHAIGTGAAALLVALAGPPALAAPGGLPTNVQHTDSSPQWENLRAKLFGSRKVDAASGKVQLIVPLRAAYGASVPVKIVSRQPQSADLYVKRLYVLVDKNPSPIAAVLDLSTELGQADFETRLRVDEYSHVRVVAELSDGSLHMDSRYVKTSGGCSAPPNRDNPELIGRTVLKLPEGLKPGAPTVADVTVLHPNDTGFELNNQTVMFIPPYFVRTVKVTYGDRTLFTSEQDFSVSENPTWRFNFLPRTGAELKAEVEDSKDGHYVGRLAVGSSGL